MSRQRVIRLQEVPERAAICGIDGEEIDHHGQAEDNVIAELGKTPVDHFVDQIRDRQKETLARVTDSLEWL